VRQGKNAEARHCLARPRHYAVANSTSSISVGSPASAFELLPPSIPANVAGGRLARASNASFSQFRVKANPSAMSAVGVSNLSLSHLYIGARTIRALAAPPHILAFCANAKWRLACYGNKLLNALLEKSYGEFDVQSNSDRNRSVYSRTSGDV
jgi:hypothetical protein